VTRAALLVAASLALAITAAAQPSSEEIERLEAAVAAHAGDAALTRALARAQLERGEVDASLKTLRSFAASHPERRAELALLLGRVLYTKGDLIAAKAALLQAVSHRSDDALAHFYLGLVQLRLGERESAARALQRAERLDPKLAERARSAARPQRRGALRALERIALLGRVGAEYDSNSTLEGDSDALALAGDRSDLRTSYQGALALELFRDSRAEAGAGYRFDRSLHADLDYLDVQSHAGWLSAGVALSPSWVARVEGGGAAHRLGGDPYLASANVGASFGFQRERWGLFELRTSGERRDYEATPALPSLERDGWRTGASLRHVRPIALWAPSVLSLQASYARTITEGERDLFGFGPAFESHFGGLDLALRAPLPLALILDARVGVARDSFDAVSLIDFLTDDGTGDPNPERRLDHVVDAQLALSRRIADWLDLELRVRETRHFSNVDLYDWDRLIVGTQLRLHWQGR
jgi:tetratricopeptide (TPR) repeat protein